MRNCGDFYVYKLQKAPVCKLRYCGVGQLSGKIVNLLRRNLKITMLLVALEHPSVTT